MAAAAGLLGICEAPGWPMPMPLPLLRGEEAGAWSARPPRPRPPPLRTSPPLLPLLASSGNCEQARGVSARG